MLNTPRPCVADPDDKRARGGFGVRTLSPPDVLLLLSPGECRPDGISDCRSGDLLIVGEPRDEGGLGEYVLTSEDERERDSRSWGEEA